MHLGVWGCITLNVKYVKIFIKNVKKMSHKNLKMSKHNIIECQNFNQKCQKCNPKVLKCQMSKTPFTSLPPKLLNFFCNQGVQKLMVKSTKKSNHTCSAIFCVNVYYGVIFAGVNTRAVHLELAVDYSTMEYMQLLGRFSCRPL